MDSKWNEDQPPEAPSMTSDDGPSEQPETGSYLRPMSATPGEVQEWMDDDSQS